MNRALSLALAVGVWIGIQPAFALNPIRLGSVGQEYGKAAATDRDGNILVGMVFQNTIDFDPDASSTVIGTPPGIDCAIAKYTTAGALVWARHWSGTTGLSANSVVTPHGPAWADGRFIQQRDWSATSDWAATRIGRRLTSIPARARCC